MLKDGKCWVFCLELKVVEERPLQILLDSVILKPQTNEVVLVQLLGRIEGSQYVIRR